jgi:hypothetical protein
MNVWGILVPRLSIDTTSISFALATISTSNALQREPREQAWRAFELDVRVEVRNLVVSNQLLHDVPPSPSYSTPLASSSCVLPGAVGVEWSTASLLPDDGKDSQESSVHGKLQMSLCLLSMLELSYAS